jgi:hypothetical protein
MSVRVAFASVLASAAVVSAAWISGCGGAPARDEAVVKDAVYQTDFTTVWNAVSAEMNERFHDGGIMKEDAANGIIISKWKSLATTATSESNSETGGNRSISALGGDFIQLRVRIDQGGPPWHITIEAEGAHRSPDSPRLEPYKRGGAVPEPVWVEGRTNSLRGAFYDRLKQYAVSSSKPAAPAAPAADGTPIAPPSGQ